MTADETLSRLEYGLDNDTRLTTLSLADRCEELGLARLAAGYRWLAERGKFPQLSGIGLWRWGPDDGDNWRDYERGSSLLPRKAYEHLKDSWGIRPNGWNHAASAAMREAAEAVGLWLEQTAEGGTQ